MTAIRVAVVTSHWGSSWDEEHVVTRRIAGALACSADVDVCVAEGPTARQFHDGAARVIQFPAMPSDARRVAALRQALLGPTAENGSFGCSCVDTLARERARSLQRSLQEELVYGAGGHSPALYSHLQDEDYDVVLFAGYQSAATYLGLRALPTRCRVALWPAARNDPLFHLPIHDETFARADVVLACTASEEALVRARLNGFGRDRTARVSFALSVNSLATETTPHGYDEDYRYLVVARDWEQDASRGSLETWAPAIERDFADAGVKVRLVGPGANHLEPFGGVSLASSRIDVWRWMSRSLAVLDTAPQRVLGREVLEAMLCGAAVLVHADGGATREHAESGNGGLWFRTYAELACCVEELLSSDVRELLGNQGADYASRDFGDADAFVSRLVARVLP